jgi:hypothetical protein
MNGVAGCATGNYRTLLKVFCYGVAFELVHVDPCVQFWRRYYVLKGRDSSMLHFR